MMDGIDIEQNGKGEPLFCTARPFSLGHFSKPWRGMSGPTACAECLTALHDTDVPLLLPRAGFKTTFVTKVRFFRPVESFSYSGPKEMSRRDQRRGSQTAVVSPTGDGGLEVDVTWSDPMQVRASPHYLMRVPLFL